MRDPKSIIQNLESGLSRRELLRRSGMGMGALALAHLMGEAGLLAETGQESPLNPLAPKRPHFAGRAKRVVHLFMNGGVSHVDTFDPKPMLEKYKDRPLPVKNLQTERKTGFAFPSPFKFRKHGRSGLEISDLYPNVAECADELCVIRSMRAEAPNHEPSLMLMNCGEPRLIRPSMGSWLTYGLGTENQNLPGFVAMCPGGYPTQETENWRSGFLPGVYQGTYINTQHTRLEKLIEHIKNPSLSRAKQRDQLDLLLELNREHQKRRHQQAPLEARIQSFELAYRMQMDAADAFDIEREPKYVREAYGSGTHGRQLLMTRRLLERGVRFVQVWSGKALPWDHHQNCSSQHRKLSREWDRPIAAFLKDLRQRGMLDETLVLWGGEFGRTPVYELPDENSGKGLGRDHNPYGFTVWMAGGGVKGGTVYGATDEFGWKSVKDVCHVHDLHATMLHLLGFDHEKFTYRYAGRDFRLTDVHGHVVREVLA